MEAHINISSPKWQIQPWTTNAALVQDENIKARMTNVAYKCFDLAHNVNSAYYDQDDKLRSEDVMKQKRQNLSRNPKPAQRD